MLWYLTVHYSMSLLFFVFLSMVESTTIPPGLSQIEKSVPRGLVKDHHTDFGIVLDLDKNWGSV